MIYKKSAEEIAIMQEGGEVLVETLDRLEEAVRPGITTAELDRIAEDAITSAGARPSFKGYRGFPCAVCASPNEVIVHGIPGPRVLEEGDIMSVDVGVYYRGFHVDSAWTFPVGDIPSDVAELLKVTEQSLWAAVERCEAGARTGDVGYAIEQVADAAGFSIVREYVGHGVGRALHEGPQIPNYGPPGRGHILSPGLVVAIEPMINAGGAATRVLDDDWTVVTADGSFSAHFEHTVAVTADGPLVITRRTPR